MCIYAWLRRIVCIVGITLWGVSVAQATRQIEVVTSFSILADFVRQVGGERVVVHTLVGPDEDAHAFQPRPSDARRIGDARLVVVNGLGFDDWMVRLARSAGYSGEIVIASTDIQPLEEKGHHGHEHHGGTDPHAWQNVANARRYVANIALALQKVDPEGAGLYQRNAQRYDEALRQLDAEIRSRLAELPEKRRKVVSSHDAFAYFAQAYGMVFLAPVGVSNDAEPSARAIAKLIGQIRTEQVPAVFIETVADPRLLYRIQAESGARIGGTLYSDALSSSSGPVPTYLAMMQHNLRVLLEALAPPAVQQD